MLPTARWKLRQAVRQDYEGRMAALAAGLEKQRAMAGEFIDVGNLEAAASMHLTLLQDQEEIDALQAKLDLLNDDACFEKVFKDREEE